jgi:hypothetical protein
VGWSHRQTLAQHLRPAQGIDGPDCFPVTVLAEAIV